MGEESQLCSEKGLMLWTFGGQKPCCLTPKELVKAIFVEVSFVKVRFVEAPSFVPGRPPWRGGGCKMAAAGRRWGVRRHVGPAGQQAAQQPAAAAEPHQARPDLLHRGGEVPPRRLGGGSKGVKMG